jgi:hypothetical protein
MVGADTGMISDRTELERSQDAWEFVRESRNLIVGNCNVATFVVGFNQAGVRDICFNLLLASAFSVLEQVLRQLRDEGQFACTRNELGALMADSRASLPWVDYALIDTARKERNHSIHARNYLSHGQCRDYIASMELELVALGVLANAMPELWHW